MTLNSPITKLISKWAKPTSNSVTSNAISCAPLMSFERIDARPEGWTGRPFRWRFQNKTFAFHLDDGTPVFWTDCAKPEAYRGGVTTNFETRVLIHPSPAVGWLLLETLTLEYGGIHGDNLGEYRIRRATPDECRPFFHEDFAIEYHHFEQVRDRMQKYFDRNGRRRTV
jgi:hypothetical protein